MIRYRFINNQILGLYSQLPSIKFPLDVYGLIDYIPNCRYMSYQEFAVLNKCSIEDVIQICESKSGCTHYDILHNRYLILSNRSEIDNNNAGRQRWTCGHEIGHVVCNHLPTSAYSKLSENNLLIISDSEYESEADYFAATLLAPFPLYETLGIKSSNDIRAKFGLSNEASFNQYKHFLSWKKNRVKTAWENDLKKMFKLKG